MAQSTFSVRMDETLKKQFDELCLDFGMNATTAFNIFARAVVREKKIPFEIAASNKDSEIEIGRSAFFALREQARTSDVSDLSLEEINAEINNSRMEKNKI